MVKKVNVTITSDLMCPWCWVGLRKLQDAMTRFEGVVEIRWKPFQLMPGAPEQGVPKGGTPASRVGARLAAAGKAVDINFTGLTDRTPNTTLFHATMEALHGETQTKFQEACFEAYFTRGVFPDERGLLDAAATVGLEDVVAKILDDETALAEHKRRAVDEARAAARRGVTGVPFFEFNGVPAFSGAQDPSTFLHYLNKAAATTP
ncbi:hypothetical protein CTAYLR_006259 [Chrysophaeum taylorii]|uniref:DSBA-like thioredoxin domain-containing protein n=1 Tax=Chrysophaeum taylorii TaxID=2483200 RepID=A0AAD7UJT7_9STRA|nr:hypothetical protein CTAYLR_006259 [Chrysophaeum taylorii]